MKENKGIANFYYDFVIEFNKTEKSYRDNIGINYKNFYREKDINKKYEYLDKIKYVMDELYRNDTMGFILQKNKKESISFILEKLSTKDGIKDLYNKLELTFQDHTFMSGIENLYEITRDIVSLEQLSIIVKRQYEIDDDYNENYFNLFLKYKELKKRLMQLL